MAKMKSPMVSAPALRAQIEAALAKKISSALTPKPRSFRRLVPTNIDEIDDLLGGGLPVGAISEIAGPESSGRTAAALACMAGMTRAGKICAWVDISDTLHPESAAGIGVDLSRMLWVRCGQKGPSTAVEPGAPSKKRKPLREKPWERLDQALRAADLLLQAGGFASIVFDMAGIEPEHAFRIPLATWFRFRTAAERGQIQFLLLTQAPCAKNSAALVLRLRESAEPAKGSTLFTGVERRAALDHYRFESQAKVLPLRKPVGSVRTIAWQEKTFWAGRA